MVFPISFNTDIDSNATKIVGHGRALIFRAMYIELAVITTDPRLPMTILLIDNWSIPNSDRSCELIFDIQLTSVLIPLLGYKSYCLIKNRIKSSGFKRIPAVKIVTHTFKGCNLLLLAKIICQKLKYLYMFYSNKNYKSK